MEILFSDAPESIVVDYVKNHYPYCNVGLVGRFDNLVYLLEKAGNKVLDPFTPKGESARFIIVVGGDEEVERAKTIGLPYLVISKNVPLSAFQRIGIYNYQIVEYSYPKLVIFDNSQNEYLFQAEVRILLLSLYLECLNTLGSGLKGERQKRAEEVIKELRPILLEFHTVSELLDFCARGIEGLGGLPFVTYLNAVLLLYHPENLLYAKFYAVFSLLYLERQFTNIDFWVILPYMDIVRVRMLAEVHGIKVPLSRGQKRDVSYLLTLVKKHIPTEEELDNYLNGFRLEGGREKVDPDAIFSAIILASCLCPKKEMVSDIVESGYIDALIS